MGVRYGGRRRGRGRGAGRKRRGAVKGFFKNIPKRTAIVILTAAVAAAAVLIVLLAVIPSVKSRDADAEPAAAYVPPEVTPSEEPEELAAEDDIPEDDGETEEEKALVVGLILGAGDGSKAVAAGFGEYAQGLVSSGSGLEKYYIYDSGESENQQIQDARALIKKGCRAIAVFGAEEHTCRAIKRICEGAGAAAIGVQAPKGVFSVSVKAGESAGYGRYLSDVKNMLASEDRILIIAGGDGSGFARGIERALEEAGLSAEKRVYTSSDKYEAELADALGEKYEVIIADKAGASDALAKAAEAGGTKYFIAEASAGLIKRWRELKNSPEYGANFKLFAYADADTSDMGRAACRFAFNFAAGLSLNTETTELEASSDRTVTDKEADGVYEEVKDLADESGIPAGVDFDAIDACFEKAENNGI